MEQEIRERINYYADIAKKKGYRDETIDMGIMLACTKNAVEKFGSEEKAFEEVIKICEKNDNPQDFINDVCRLIEID